MLQLEVDAREAAQEAAKAAAAVQAHERCEQERRPSSFNSSKLQLVPDP